MECSICLCEAEDPVSYEPCKKCKSNYCRACLTRWLENNHACPICKVAKKATRLAAHSAFGKPIKIANHDEESKRAATLSRKTNEAKEGEIREYYARTMAQHRQHIDPRSEESLRLAQQLAEQDEQELAQRRKREADDLLLAQQLAAGDAPKRAETLETDPDEAYARKLQQDEEKKLASRKRKHEEQERKSLEFIQKLKRSMSNSPKAPKDEGSNQSGGKQGGDREESY